jgi:hypothetical protein
MNVCLAPFWLLWQAPLGGHAWVLLNWAFGFRANACEVTLLEILRPEETPEGAVQRVREFRGLLDSVGLDANIALLLSQNQKKNFRGVRDDLERMTVPAECTWEDADLLFSLIYDLDPDVVSRFSRCAVVDIDPGLLQHWISEGQLRLTPHDLYFTIGETVGTPKARFPDAGIDWIYTPPPVHLPSWPKTSSKPDAPLTTVGNWWGVSERQSDVVFNNEKRTSFLDYLDLPSQSPLPLELALYPPGESHSEWRELEAHGWRVRSSLEVSSTPSEYRRYIQRSRGEFSCAKPSCMRFANAWISDRSLCYLASGKPVVVQHTGRSCFLPDAAGMFRFRSPAEAVRALEVVQSDYEEQSRLARALAEEHFDARKVVGAVLDKAMAVRPRGRSNAL